MTAGDLLFCIVGLFAALFALGMWLDGAGKGKW